MDTTTVLYFWDIAKGKTFFDVAEDFHTTQSSVSKAVMRLEQELGAPLFDRSHRCVSLTPAGEIFLKAIEQIMPIVNQTRKEIDALSQRHIVNVGIIPQTNFMNLDLRISSGSFPRLHPEIFINLMGERFIDQNYEMLNQGAISMTVSLLFQITRDYCDYEEVGENPMYVLLPKEHPLSGEEVIDFVDLYQEHVIVRSFFVRRVLQESCNHLGLDMMPNLEFLSSRYREFTRIDLINQVGTGLGISFYFRNDLRELNLRNISCIPVTNVPAFPVVLAKKRGIPLKPWEQLVWDYLKEEIMSHPEW